MAQTKEKHIENPHKFVYNHFYKALLANCFVRSYVERGRCDAAYKSRQGSPCRQFAYYSSAVLITTRFREKGLYEFCK